MNKKSMLAIISVLVLNACYPSWEEIERQKNYELQELRKQYVGKTYYKCDTIDLFPKKVVDVTLDGTLVFENNAQENDLCTEAEFYSDKNIFYRELSQNPDAFLLKNKNSIYVLSTYLDIFNPIKSELYEENRYNEKIYGVRYWYIHGIKNEKFIDWIQSVSNPNVKIKCFVKNSSYSDNNWADTSDECILARRNDNGEFWFNYKRYLPNIKNDEEFKNLISTFNKYYTSGFGMEDKLEYEIKQKYCENLTEITTTEREKCRQEVNNFLNQLMNGTVLHCHDKANKEWNKMLVESEEARNTLDALIKRENDSVSASPLAHDIVNAMYANSTYQAMVSKIKQFGYDNFCITDGWEVDLKALNKQVNTGSFLNRKGQIVELN